MKKVLLTNWHFMRFLRLSLAMFLFYNAYVTHEWFFIAFGVFFLVQSLLNMGCGANGCGVNFNKTKNNE